MKSQVEKAWKLKNEKLFRSAPINEHLLYTHGLLVYRPMQLFYRHWKNLLPAPPPLPSSLRYFDLNKSVRRLSSLKNIKISKIWAKSRWGEAAWWAPWSRYDFMLLWSWVLQVIVHMSDIHVLLPGWAERLKHTWWQTFSVSRPE